MAEADKIYVYENWSGDIPVKMGTLYVDGNRVIFDGQTPMLDRVITDFTEPKFYDSKNSIVVVHNSSSFAL